MNTIENRPDTEGGMDAESARLFSLTLSGTPVIIQPARTRTDADFCVDIYLTHLEAGKDLQSEHSAEIRFQKPMPDGKESPTSDQATYLQPAILGDGPLVLFGDSITALRGSIKTYGEGLREIFSERDWPIKILNAGVAGNTTERAAWRLERDVLSHHPSLVVILLGTNDAAVDVWKDPPAAEPRVALADYRANLEYFVDEIRDQGSQVILMTPPPLRWTPTLRKLYGKSPYHLEDENGLNVILKSYVEAVRTVAKEKKVPLVDLYAAFNDFPKKSGGTVDSLLPDGMHPGDEGQALIRDLLVSAWTDEPLVNNPK